MAHGMAERVVERNFAGDRLEESSGPISVDLAVFTLAGRELSVLLTERTEPPYPGFWSLPGTLRRAGISLDAQARSLQTAVTGIEGGWIEQLKTFHRPQQVDAAGHVVVPGRDPRGDVLSVSYIAIVPTAMAESCAEHDACTLRREMPRRRFAQPAARAGDDDDFAFDVIAHTVCR